MLIGTNFRIFLLLNSVLAANLAMFFFIQKIFRNPIHGFHWNHTRNANLMKINILRRFRLFELNKIGLVTLRI